MPENPNKLKKLLNIIKQNPIPSVLISIVLAGASISILKPQTNIISSANKLEILDRKAQETIDKNLKLNKAENQSLKNALLQFNNKFQLWTIKDAEIRTNGDVAIYLHRNAPDEYNQSNQEIHDRLVGSENNLIQEFFEGNGIYSKEEVGVIDNIPIKNGNGDQGRVISEKDLSKFYLKVNELQIKPNVNNSQS